MRNLIIATGFLIVALLGIFIFTSNSNNEIDTVIPTPVPVNSPKQVLNLPQATDQANMTHFPVLEPSQIKGKKVEINTTKGNILIEFFDDSPIAASNFINLVNKKFYDGLTFHRVEKGVVIQGGDPKGDGTGGPGYSFEDEPVKHPYLRGTVAMANAGPNTNGSQFFIVLKDVPSLPKNYTIFGQVVEGLGVIDTIEIDDKIMRATIF